MTIQHRMTAVALILAAGTLSAQEVTGTVTGTIRDANGKPVAGASLRITGAGGIQSRSAQTDAQGNFRVPLLLPGEYQGTITKDGFVAAKAEFRITGGGVIRQDVVLKAVTTASATVEIVDTVAQVDKTQTKTAATFNQDSFSEIPLSGNYASRALAGLAISPAVIGNQLYQSVRGGGQGQAQYLVNGLTVRDNITMQGRPQDVILDDLIEESQVVLSPLNAKYGDSSSGLINVIEKTGGNEFTGSLRIKLDRPTWTARRPNGYTRTTIGTQEPGAASDDLSRTYELAVTGPVIKDRLTFTYGTRLQPTSLSTVNIDPGTTGFALWKSSAAGAYQVVDANRYAAQAAPAAFGGATKFTFHQARLYWQITPEHSLDYSHSEGTNQFFDYNSNYPTLMAPTSLDTDQHSLNKFRQLSYRGLFGTNHVIEARFGKRESQVKFPGGPGDPIQVRYYQSTATSFNSANSVRFVNGAGADSQAEIRNTESAAVNWNWFPGSHNIDFGWNYTKTIWGTVQNSGGPNGITVVVPGQLYRDPVSSAILGPNDGFVVFPYNSLPAGSTLGTTPLMQQYLGVQKADLEKPTHALYANDLWTVNNHLSLMGGLRYEKWKYADGIGKGYSSSDISKRAELKWDLEGNGKRIMSLSYGEFRGNVGERITRQQSVFRRSTLVNRRWSVASPNGPNSTYYVNAATLLDPNNYGNIVSFDDPGKVYQFQPDFRPERNKEIVLGFRRAYAGGGYLTINLVSRKWDDLPMSFGDTTQVNVSDPTGGPLVIPNYTRTLVNDPNATRSYQGAEFTFKAPLFNNKVNVSGSYTYARTKANSFYGDSTGFAFTQGLATTGLFRDQFHALGIASESFEPQGLAATSIGQNARLLVTYTAGVGRMRSVISLMGRYDAGTPQDLSNNVVIPGSNTGTGVSSLNPSMPAGVLPTTYLHYYGRGTHTTPDFLAFDLGYSLSMPLTKRVSGFLEIQVINVFNQVRIAALDRTNSGTVQATPIGYRVSSVNNYGYPTSFSSYGGARDFNLNFGFRF